VSLDVVVPDLLLPRQAPAELRALRLPHLERWIARGRRERIDLPGTSAWLATQFALDSPWPVAAVTLAADAGPREGQWLRADPVHLRVGNEAVTLHDASVLEVHRDEASALVGTLQRHFAADGLEFVAAYPSRWYVRVPESEVPRTTSLEDAVGRNVFGLLPRGEGRINWGGAITETQMLFAEHPVNVEREARGRPAINSVWFWGEGLAPDRVASPYESVYADDAFARGLARLSGARLAESPVDPERVDSVEPGHSALVVLDSLTGPLRRGDSAAWLKSAGHLDEKWFAHMPRLLERFEAVRIVLPSHHETRLSTIDPGARWRWFRARVPLNADA